MNERTLLKGRLAEAELDIEMLRATCENNMITIRQLIDPYAQPEDLRLSQAEVAIRQLRTNQEKLIDKLELVKKLKADLYG